MASTRGACGASRPWRPSQGGGEPRAPTKPDEPPTTLDELWRAKPIRRLMLVCVRNGGGVDVTVHATSRQAPLKDPMRLARSEVFHSEASKAAVVARAVQLLSEWNDRDFADAVR
jgi:hypothetical protein